MKKLTLYYKDDYSYIFIDTNQKKYELNIEFNGLDFDLKSGDTFYFPDKILKKENFYAFGPALEKYARQKHIDENEFIKIISDDQEFFLQRYYG